jgi:hypothetical protein
MKKACAVGGSEDTVFIGVHLPQVKLGKVLLRIVLGSLSAANIGNHCTSVDDPQLPFGVSY